MKGDEEDGKNNINLENPYCNHWSFFIRKVETFPVFVWNELLNVELFLIMSFVFVNCWRWENLKFYFIGFLPPQPLGFLLNLVQFFKISMLKVDLQNFQERPDKSARGFYKRCRIKESFFQGIFFSRNFFPRKIYYILNKPSRKNYFGTSPC